MKLIKPQSVVRGHFHHRPQVPLLLLRQIPRKELPVFSPPKCKSIWE